MLNKNEILDYLKTLKPSLEINGISKLGIFGSYAKDSADEQSDIDVCYETSERFIQSYKGWNAFVYLDENLRNKLSQKFDKKVDLFDLNSDAPLKPLIQREALYV
ncbi:MULTISPECIES: nucleotidyltransferase domain-containing protein [unclassified Sulfurospirillum]|uniref:nucleotidyltransferase family protein n=1 Tax=unclassified Sulfurospirillum TaxID=2618290 RepID=UPI000507BADF|nr:MULTISPECIES: nucleotidyltransferase domain-containing protein [unclassified Sulfurospirillum]KFL34479.1 hypothetical protein JU57_05555 [Sulfurospirillum sp. SCADC]